MYLFDTFTNFLSGLGMPGRDKMTAVQHVTTVWTRDQLEASYRTDWIARKAIAIPAHDATREWRAWQAEQKQIELLEATEERLQLQLKLQMALVKARLYGGCCLLIGVDGRMSSELDPETIKKDGLKFIHVLAPHELTIEELEKDISNPYFGQPTFYRLQDGSKKYGDVEIHPSRMVRLIGLDAPDPMRNQGWGDPLMSMISDAVNAAGTVAGSVATLISEAKLDVIKIPGLTEIFSTSAGTNRLIKRFTEANVAKSVINGLVMDAEEEWQRIGVQFQGIPEVLQMYLQIASGAADIPMTRFLGMSPGGLNATGDSDLVNYYDRIASDQELRLTPALEKLDKAVQRSALGKFDENIFYEWRPLWQMSEEQKATIAKQKADSAKVDADSGLVPFEALVQGRCNQLIEDGTYPGLEAALEDAIENQELLAEQVMEQAPAQAANENDPFAEEGMDGPMEGDAPQQGPPKKKKKAFGDAGVADKSIGPFEKRLSLMAEALGLSTRWLRDRLIPWDEEKHPRGQPENAGQFAPSGGGGGSSVTSEPRRNALEALRKARGIPSAVIRPPRSAEFVSPSVKSGLDFKGAVKELTSRQQARLGLASKDVNEQVGIEDAHEVAIVGAWSDGAENSIMWRSSADWNQTVLAAAMKGHLADQKAVLVFQQQERGVSVLAQFEAKGRLNAIHKNLLVDGIENHTIVPHADGKGATVYVVDLDGSTLSKVVKAAERYDNDAYYQTGRAEFIGNTDYTDDKGQPLSDREQRDRAREVYESIINQSSVKEAQAIWQDVRNRWSEAPKVSRSEAGHLVDQYGRWLAEDDDDPIDTDAVEARTKANVAVAGQLARDNGTVLLPGSKAQHPATIASRNPTAKGTKRNPAPPAAYGKPDVESMRLEQESYDHNVNLFRNDTFYSNFRADDLAGDSDQAVRTVVDQMKENLKFLYSFADKHTQVWYDGARALVDDRVKLWGFNDASVAGVYAALSPTKDWDQNVHIADMLMETYKNKQDTVWSPEMDEKANTLWSAKNMPIVDKVRGKKLGELTTAAEKAVWIRTYDETHNDTEYRRVLPDGSLGSFMTNKDGTSQKVVWQSLPSITNAINALEANGDRDKISAAMGTAHKVRSFYNNILDPHSRNADVTIDTHAVGAALLRQLTGDDAAVMHNFGLAPERANKPEGWEATSNSIKTGLSGTYSVYADAYREAAAELGIQARQLQSAVWVVKRETFSNLSDKQAESVEAIWRAYRNSDLTLRDAHAAIAELAGLNRYGRRNRDDANERRAGDARELHQSRMGQPAAGMDSGVGGGASRGIAGLEPVRAARRQAGAEDLSDKSWREEDHPRGQPENKGQFGPGGGGTGKSTSAKGSRVAKGKPKRSGVSGKEATAAEALAAASARRAGKKAGADGHPGEGYSKHAKVIDGVIHTSDVEDAAKALMEHRKVELDQPRGVSVVLSRLGEVADKMIQRGEKAPTINLCNLSVKGSNLFCAGNMGKTRDTMPQMDEAQTVKFIEYLKGKGYKVSEEEQYASHLRATQNELNGVKVAGIAKAIRANQFDPTQTRTVISDDDYVLDGHHRWAAKIGNDSHDGNLTNDSKYPVSRINIKITKLLEEADIFTEGKGRKGVGEGTETPQQVGEKKKHKDASWREDLHPRGQPENAGQFGPGGGGASATASAEGKPAAKIERARVKAKGGASPTGASAAEVLAAARTRGEKPEATAKRRDKLRSETGRTGPSELAASIREENARWAVEQAEGAERLAARMRGENPPVTSAEERRREALIARQRGGTVPTPEDEEMGARMREALAARGTTFPTPEEGGMTLAQMMAESDRLAAARSADEVIAAGTTQLPPIEDVIAEKEAKAKKPTTKADFDKAGIRLRSYGEEEDALDDWNRFIGLPPEEFKEKFLGGLKGTIRINADPDSDKFDISGKFEGEGKFKGQYVAEFDRVLDLRNKKASSSLFEIIDAAQGEGYGKQFLAGNIAMYEAAGINKVEVTAGLKMGGYAWAKYGYVPRQDDWDDIRHSMKRQIGAGEGSGRSSRGEEYEASDWDELSGDQQEEVRTQWYRESHDEFVDSEIDRWREDGVALDDGKMTVAEEFNNMDGTDDWARDALEDVRANYRVDGVEIPFDDDQLLNAMRVEYEGDGQGGGDFTVQWKDDSLNEPKGIDPRQKTLPGLDKIKGHERLTEQMRESIQTRMEYRFERAAEDKANSIDPPDFGDQVSEYQDEVWDSMGNSQRMEMAQRYGQNMIEIESDEPKTGDDFDRERERDPEGALNRELLDALNSSNPKSIWDVADHPRGRDLLRRQGWSGTLNMRDPETMARFKAYVGRPRKKDADAARRY